MQLTKINSMLQFKIFNQKKPHRLKKKLSNIHVKVPIMRVCQTNEVTSELEKKLKKPQLYHQTNQSRRVNTKCSTYFTKQIPQCFIKFHHNIKQPSGDSNVCVSTQHCESIYNFLFSLSLSLPIAQSQSNHERYQSEGWISIPCKNSSLFFECGFDCLQMR